MIVAAVLRHDAVLDDDDLVGVAQRLLSRWAIAMTVRATSCAQGFDTSVRTRRPAPQSARRGAIRIGFVADERAGDPRHVGAARSTASYHGRRRRCRSRSGMRVMNS